MKPRKILNNNTLSKIQVNPIFNATELVDRDKDYAVLTDKDFDSKYKERVYQSVMIDYGSNYEEIQYNFCSDTFCPNYAEELEIIKPRGARSIKNYKFIGSKDESKITCNIMNNVGASTSIFNNHSTLHSNWSIAEEIKRLSILNSVVDEEVEYHFHDTVCPDTSTPFDDVNSFVKFGKTKAGSIRYKCKVCGKTTAIKPSIKQRHMYNQKRSDVIMSIFEDLISRVPVTKICEKNNIGSSTFYDKVEFIYKKCLEFLERHESKLVDVNFDDLYLCSDDFVYSLNNIRRKGKGGKKQTREEKANSQEAITHMIATGDVDSAYVFRADISYDSVIRLSDIEDDTARYHCDHSFRYLKKNERINTYSYKPQPPTAYDSETPSDYQAKLAMFNARDNFVEGLHVQRPYTTIAHFHLLEKLLNYNKLILVSDDDKTIQQSAFKAFSSSFKDQEAFYFTSQYDKSLDRQEAYEESIKARNELNKWGKKIFPANRNMYEKAFSKISADLSSHSFYGSKVLHGYTFLTRGKNPISHPLPAIDEGRRYINLISYQNCLSNDKLAEMIVSVNTRTVDNFFQEIRRHINLLERPLVGGRGAGKTYIYSNYNPKYAQQLVTIYRTYYNFIKPRKYYNRKIKDLTPAMRIGITNKPYSIRDIVYFI